MRRFTLAAGLCLFTVTTPLAGETPAKPEVQTRESQAAMTPSAALERLKAGNARFAANEMKDRDWSANVVATASGQFPYAAILACMDSRAPVEVVFDQGLGDVFGIRVGGNVVNDDELGSLEYALKVGAKLNIPTSETLLGKKPMTTALVPPALALPGAGLHSNNSVTIINPGVARSGTVVATLTDASFPLTESVLKKMSGLSGAEFVVLDSSGAPEDSSRRLGDADIETLRQTTKYPIASQIPLSGTPLLVEGIGIVRGTKHAALAKEFYEFVTTPEALRVAAESDLAA